MEFVSFEIAKKLKDLGFDESSLFFYREDDEDKCVHCVDINKPLTHYNGAIIAPTISQVLKWLRKEKEIMVFPVYSKNTSRWYCSIINADSLESYNLPLDDSYEEATFVGIEYALDNLV